ncbi:SAF domain-containing protein [Microbacterium sp. W1N]|uniref:SAF domain-containing protein n=1 Tax=Microbacterium festucae TaxID=2977531 RepID=UPI0021BF9D16|nr:SAF domain-containing protein [Microbacterium festucae]MCT9818718.1 SAF domain-containing protein [Microbacterium festucae]
MTTADAARPRARAFWSDARFLLGVALIAASIAGVWAVVAVARTTVPVFAATRTIVPGEAVSGDDLRVVEVALGQVGEAYTAPGLLEPGAVATRTIAAGELIPRSAVGDAGAARTTTVVVDSATDVPAAIVPGSVVEVWSAAPLEGGRFDTPRILVPAATVAAVATDDGVVASAGASLELVIDRADVADTLAAVAAGASLSVVPLSGAGTDAAAEAAADDGSEAPGTTP